MSSSCSIAIAGDIDFAKASIAFGSIYMNRLCAIGAREAAIDLAALGEIVAITENAVQAPRCIMQSVSTGILESGGGKFRRNVRVCL